MERMTHFDPRVLGRPFVIQHVDPNDPEDPGILKPSIFWDNTCDAVRIYGDIIDRLAYYEETFFSKPVATTDQPETMTREKILDAAKKCVCGDREEDYGSPENNFRTIANLWADYLQGRGAQIDFLEPHDVAAMLGLLKIARIASGHGKADNWVDLAGYAACGGELEGADG